MSFARNFKRILKGNIGIIVVSWVLFGIGNVLVYPYFSIYVKLLGGGDFDIGLVNSISSVAGLLLTIPGGYLTDVYGRKRIIIFGSMAHFYTPALRTIVADSLPEDSRAHDYS